MRFITLKLKGCFQVRCTVMILVLFLGLSLVSCIKKKDSPGHNESELLQKINAVQEQVMAQGNLTKEEEQAMLSLCSIMSNNDGLANYNPNARMVLKDVDFVPVLVGCEALSKEDTRHCFKQNVKFFIETEFNLNLSQDLNLSSPKQVEAFFIIDDTGHLTGMKVRDSEITIQAEIIRVLKRMPVMTPALYQDQEVSVLCSLLLTYGDEIKVDIIPIPEFPDRS